ncbi:phospholipase A1 VesT1.02 isoform X2 [Bactrocera dorsalis]|uniref:Phospholipase A1 VesT1.02 isoform X2 n=1 Tax=Bactrocera dorsalis TaxID=27457 RepID=A0A8N4LA28_BACDO|nr:phospholipase A1 VesT1.02 isoform X2 [Bactrocera dorsalis]
MQIQYSIVPIMVSLVLTSRLGLVSANNTNCNATKSWLVPQTSGAPLLVTAVTLAATILPFTISERNVKFFLLTSDNPTKPYELSIGDVNSLNSSPFNPGGKIIVVIHGWLNDRNSPMCQTVAAAAIATNNTNVIIVDWGCIAKTPNYIYAAKSVRLVGRIVAQFLDFLCQNKPVVRYNIIVIGHSLGAHVAGFAGRFYTLGTILAIYALDAAGPLFDYCHPETRLCKSDATYVEDMHTGSAFLSMRESLGHASFYVNGGERQDKYAPDLFGYCSHKVTVSCCVKAPQGYRYPSIRCATYTDATKNECGSTLSPESMVWLIHTNISGIFYVNATDEPEYKLGSWKSI